MRLEDWHSKWSHICANGEILPEIVHIALDILWREAIFADNVPYLYKVDLSTKERDIIPVDSNRSKVRIQLLNILRSTVDLETPRVLALKETSRLAASRILVDSNQVFISEYLKLLVIKDSKGYREQERGLR